MGDKLLFGIYPGGRAGTHFAAPNDRDRIDHLVSTLQAGRPFVVREYVHFFGTRADSERMRAIGAEREMESLTMPDSWYAANGRRLDLVLSYIPTERDPDGWLAFIHTAIRRYGSIVSSLQVTLEPNFPIPWIDGSSPGVVEALTCGIPHARRLLDAAGRADVAVGFSVAEPAEWLGGDAAFWDELAPLADGLAACVDYVGLGLYPDAFSPVPPLGSPGDVADLTRRALRHLRKESLTRGRIGSAVPIHVSENGSPDGPGRTPDGQASSIEAMVRAIDASREEFRVTQYALFALRDADSGSDEAVCHLGLTTDSYEPKPAFHVYRRLVKELG